MPNSLTETTYAEACAALDAEYAASYAGLGQAPFVGGRVLSLDKGKYAGLGVCVKTNPSTVVVRLDNGTQVKFPYSLVAPAPADAPAAPSAEVAARSHFTLGEVVSFSGAGARKFPGLYVVIKTSPDKVNVARIGGDSDRYVRANVIGLQRVTLDPTLLAAATVASVIKVG